MISMRKRSIIAAGATLALVFSGCATKKYARNAVNEKVTPLEQRTGELEETSRRNSQDISKLNEGLVDAKGRADRAQSQADSALARANQANTRVDATEQSLNELRANLDKYSIQATNTVNFKFDSYALSPEAKATLDSMASKITDKNNFVLEIEGFADYVGTAEYNNQLTQKRADAVRRYLAEQHNIPVFRMYIIGLGQSRPVADNHTSAGRSENRRVEVRLLVRGASPSSSTAAQTSSREK
jgi:outer membrane protein OmpA-like peptidoglycan-associated protein